MSYTMQDFQRDYVKNHLGVLSPDEIMNKFSPNDRLKGLSPNEVLNSFSPNDRLKGLSLSERLTGISFEDIQQYLKKHFKKKRK